MGTAAIIAIIAVICVLIQKFFKKYLESDQYYYLKDITLVGAWAICGIWMPDGPLRITVAAGVAAACIGFCQRATRGKNLRFLYFLIGLVFSLFGPRIAFIEFTNGEYYYLSYFVSIAISTLWVGIFPIFFQEIDEIPGLCGLLLTVSWTMISAVIFSSSQSLRDASQICIIGLVFILRLVLVLPLVLVVGFELGRRCGGAADRALGDALRGAFDSRRQQGDYLLHARAAAARIFRASDN